MLQKTFGIIKLLPTNKRAKTYMYVFSSFQWPNIVKKSRMRVGVKPIHRNKSLA